MSVRKFFYKTDDLKQELLDSDLKHIVYYADDRTILLYADCRDVMPELKKLGIKPKTVIADPPYNVGQDFPNDKMEDMAFEIFTDNWISKVYDMMPVNSCFFMFYHQFGMWKMKNLLDKYDWEYLNLIIWAYPNFHNLRGSLPKIRSKKKKNRFPLSYQVIFFYGKDFCDDLQKQMYELNIKDRKDVWTDAAPQSTYKKPGSTLSSLFKARKCDIKDYPFYDQ